MIMFKKKSCNIYCKECQSINARKFRKSMIAYIIVMLMLIALFITLRYNPSFYYNSNNIIVKNQLETHNIIMTDISEDFQEDELVKSIATICSGMETNYGKIECVHKISTMNFYYRVDKHLFYTPNETIYDGGVCRDWSVLFKSIYSLMGFDPQLVLTSDHVYVTIIENNNYWVVDQQMISKNSIPL